MQAGAFSDYQPGAASAADSGGDNAPAESSDGQQEPEQEAPSGSGGGGDFPPHQLLAMPALSPTMSAGVTPRKIRS